MATGREYLPKPRVFGVFHGSVRGWLALALCFELHNYDVVITHKTHRIPSNGSYNPRHHYFRIYPIET